MTNNDIELLKFAAIACGELQGEWIDNEAYFEGVLRRWNPLENDGDAFRLALELKFDLWHSDNYKAIAAGIVSENNMFDAKLHSEWKRNDPCAAARRAIVRAAAEIGKLKRSS